MQKKLYRNRKDKVLGGVAAGLAEYLNVDITLVRLGFVLLGLADGAGLLLYLAMWLVIPEQDADTQWS